MTKDFFIDRHRGGERALLIHTDFSDQGVAPCPDEFHALAVSAQLTIIDAVVARRTSPSPKYLVGEGKATELQALVTAHCIEVVLFSHTLSPSQGRNLEQLFQCRVLDRTELILDIFAQRARTFEGKLQVELAQLQHIRTRLVRGWTHLERQKGGIGLRGPGETQLETDRRLVDVRIRHLKKRLQKVSSQRAQGRRARQRAALPVISCVGYTNAGKSTLFNRLVNGDVLAADQLFATLDPTLRQQQLSGIGKVIFADTVGFVRDLPHALVAAFSATLEETRDADILLHVVDSQQPNPDDAMVAVNRVLHEIGAADVPVLEVFNKIDLDDQASPRIDYSADAVPLRVWLSAQTGAGMDLLAQALLERLQAHRRHYHVTLSHDAGRQRALLHALGVVISEETDEQGRYRMEIILAARDYDRIFGSGE